MTGKREPKNGDQRPEIGEQIKIEGQAKIGDLIKEEG